MGNFNITNQSNSFYIPNGFTGSSYPTREQRIKTLVGVKLINLSSGKTIFIDRHSNSDKKLQKMKDFRTRVNKAKSSENFIVNKFNNKTITHIA